MQGEETIEKLQLWATFINERPKKRDEHVMTQYYFLPRNEFWATQNQNGRLTVMTTVKVLTLPFGLETRETRKLNRFRNQCLLFSQNKCSE